MPRLAEDAIKLSILNHPQTFGLAPSEVNPMLMFVQHCIEQGAPHNSVELWKHCFDAVNETLHQKIVEVFTGLSVIQGKAQDAAIAAESGDEVAQEPQPTPAALTRKSGNGKQAGNGVVIGSPGRELSVKQLRYLGYLIRQSGEEPDYSIISRFTQKEATLRIKDLEAKVNAR
jgi:hypothetical protein